MGRADSPLRDRVIFVEGAPRSGTTWLVNLLATHPEIAGVEAESHLFDYAVDRVFDNFERRDPNRHGLSSYVERDELVDLVRAFCDGLLTSMAAHVSVGTSPRFVVEKTPIGDGIDGLDMTRKRECYPDAWYLHIVRDREAVTRSLMRAPWSPDRSHGACAAVWDRTVGHARATLGDLPRYRELSYEGLRADPGKEAGEVFGWLGIDAGPEVLDRVRTLSREPFSDLGTVAGAPEPSIRAAARTAARTLNSRTRAAVRRRLNSVSAGTGAAAAGQETAFRMVEMLRARDGAALGALTASSLELVYRSAERDLSARGDDGRTALLGIAEDTFARTYVGDWWASSGGPGEFWTSAPGKPFWTIFFSGLGGDGTRVDLAIGLVLGDDELVTRAVVVSAGPLSGRAVAARDPG